MTRATIRLVHRHPTVKLAEHTRDFLPNCGWRPVEEGGAFWLEYSDISVRAGRQLAYLRHQYPQLRFELREVAT